MEMFIDDLVDVFAINIAVPDFVGIDHEHRAEFAAVKATGRIDAHLALAGKPQLLDPGLGVLANFGGIAASAALFAAVALVGAEKDVVFVKGHAIALHIFRTEGIVSALRNVQNPFMRHYSPIDRFLIHADTALRTIAGKPPATHRPYPAQEINDIEMDESQKRHVAALMRVNHAGEVSAQALYQGQSITARNPQVREKLEQAALEENDHLVWTANRLRELGAGASLLNPLWYAGSFAIGAFAGALGDRWNLGFLAETEHQVVKHLDEHIDRLPQSDLRSQAILQQMKVDEARHATTALDHGGGKLPLPVRKLMLAMSKIMTRTAYRI